MSEISKIAAQMKLESPVLAATTAEKRNEALAAIRAALLANADAIFAANKIDMENAEKDGIAPAVMKRLKFDEKKMQDVTAGIDDLIALPDPLGKVLLDRNLDEDLRLYRISCPIGVIGVIFEARPDALIQIATLCLKSGNCALLKGGSETLHTNKTIFDVIYKAAVESGLPARCLYQIEAREDINALLSCHDYVDLLIPRGSNAFVQYIMNNTKIAVMGHADGLCHVYVHEDADIEKILPVVVDAKIQYTAACNAAETLLVDRSIAEEFLPKLKAAYEAEQVEILGTPEVQEIIACEPATDADFETEYLALKISVKLVDGPKEAIEHINRFGSHHTDAIMTENDAVAEQFLDLVDSAGVYRNCSTRFADGFRYGFGAEVGISTGKIHARGPVGLEGLVTYKYKLYGNGNIVADYASGKRSFHFVDNI